jgi:hypothetical protein
VVAALTDNIHQTNIEILCKRRPHHPKAASWWNPACTIMVQNLRNAHGPLAQKITHGRLRGTIRAAKCKWVDKYIEKAQLWDIASWRHGHRLTKIPALKGPEGLVHAHDQIADILLQRFFAQTPPTVNTQFNDDPPPCPT